MGTARWVRSLNGDIRGEASPGRPHLVCFPPSGGTTSFFRGWLAGAAPVHVQAVQYPGRADRITEQSARDVSEMARAVRRELRSHDEPIVLYGHSLGALVAFETARSLQDIGRPVKHLLVSGCRGPGLIGGTTHRRDDDELWSEVVALGGVDHEIAGDAELRDLLLPALRADITASETYRSSRSAVTLTSPVRCYYGDRDPLVDEVSARAWSQTTDGPFTMRELPGGHFPTPDVLAEIRADLMAAASPEPTSPAPTSREPLSPEPRGPEPSSAGR